MPITGRNNPVFNVYLLITVGWRLKTLRLFRVTKRFYINDFFSIGERYPIRPTCEWQSEYPLNEWKVERALALSRQKFPLITLTDKCLRFWCLSILILQFNIEWNVCTFSETLWLWEIKDNPPKNSKWPRHSQGGCYPAIRRFWKKRACRSIKEFNPANQPLITPANHPLIKPFLLWLNHFSKVIKSQT